MSTYPGGILVKGDVVNFVDVVDEGDHNILKGEIIALETYIGTNPQGNRASLTGRLAPVMSGSGGFVLTTGVPTETYPGLYFFRTDLNILYVINSAYTAQAVGASITNNAFTYGFGGVHSTGQYGFVGSALANTLGDFSPYWANATGAFQTMIQGRIVKLGGMTTITAHFLTTVIVNPADDERAKMRISIGSVTGTAVGTTLGTAGVREWTTTALNVSGLDVGTYYNLIIELMCTDPTGGVSGNSSVKLFMAQGIVS